MDLPIGHWPHPTRADKVEFMKDAMKSLHSAGIVGVHDAGVLPEDVEMYDWYAMSTAALLLADRLEDTGLTGKYRTGWRIQAS